MSEASKLTEKQKAALQDARNNGGRIFQLPERVTHAPGVLASLTRRKLLDRMPVGVIWEITAAGREALGAQESR
jgi:hypothetical protein